MKFEIGHKKNQDFLDGIEELDKDSELARKTNDSDDDLSWLETARKGESTDFLKGIENLN